MRTGQKIKAKLGPAICHTPRLVVILGLVLLPTFAQTRNPIEGVVAAEDGHPISGVVVYNSEPIREQTTTDRRGVFRLKHPGAVIHFSGDRLQPLTVVVKARATGVRITMYASTNMLVVPTCGTVRPGRKRVGWSSYGLQFEVPMTDVSISGGRPDVDYVRYVIEPKLGEANLEIWLGPSAIGIDPDAEMFMKSVRFEQRNVVSADGRTMGMDSWGTLRNGARWRQAAIVDSGGSIYENTSPQDSTLFDQIIDSVCTIPNPRVPHVPIPLPPSLR